MRIFLVAALCAASLFARVAHAQDAVQPVAVPIDAPACCRLPAGTPIEIEIRDAVDSAKSQRGDKFAIAVHAPVYVGQQLVIPAGTPGVGEVVHADRARGGGKPGELILAARFLDLDGRRIPLRGMKLGTTGVDKFGKAMGLASIPVVGLFTYVRGGETFVPQGALAAAKLAEAFDAATAPVDAAPATESVPSSTNAVSKE